MTPWTWTWRNVLLAVLLVGLLSLEWNDPIDPPDQDEYGCICDGAQGECRPHPLAEKDIACNDEQ
jgi:hypothetical protein